jgi:hypothetical protein
VKNTFVHSWYEYCILFVLVAASIMLTMCGWDTLWDTVRTLTGICLGSWIMWGVGVVIWEDLH